MLWGSAPAPGYFLVLIQESNQRRSRLRAASSPESGNMAEILRNSLRSDSVEFLTPYSPIQGRRARPERAALRAALAEGLFFCLIATLYIFCFYIFLFSFFFFQFSFFIFHLRSAHMVFRNRNRLLTLRCRSGNS